MRDGVQCARDLRSNVRDVDSRRHPDVDLRRSLARDAVDADAALHLRHGDGGVGERMRFAGADLGSSAGLFDRCPDVLGDGHRAVSHRLDRVQRGQQALDGIDAEMGVGGSGRLALRFDFHPDEPLLADPRNPEIPHRR